MHAIETDRLTKNYGKVRGIIDLNLKINEGEIFGFIGPNGSGKTTTIRLFLSLLFPTSGSGKIFNYNIAKDGPRIKKIVGFIPTEVNYYENMTVKELIEYSARFYKISLDHRFNQLVDALDLDLSRKIDDLSMGNKKKVAVVQSLIQIHGCLSWMSLPVGWIRLYKIIFLIFSMNRMKKALPSFFLHTFLVMLRSFVIE